LPHRTHHFLIDLFLTQQQIKYPFPPRFRATLHIHVDYPNKKTVPLEQPLAHYRMHMAVPAHQIAKGLNGPHVTGFPLSSPASLAQGGL
jgi:hypothetical protein